MILDIRYLILSFKCNLLKIWGFFPGQQATNFKDTLEQRVGANFIFQHDACSLFSLEKFSSDFWRDSPFFLEGKVKKNE